MGGAGSGVGVPEVGGGFGDLVCLSEVVLRLG